MVPGRSGVQQPYNVIVTSKISVNNQDYCLISDSMPSDTVVSNSIGWSNLKVKRLRDKLYNAPSNYYHLAILNCD